MCKIPCAKHREFCNCPTDTPAPSLLLPSSGCTRAGASLAHIFSYDFGNLLLILIFLFALLQSLLLYTHLRPCHPTAHPHPTAAISQQQPWRPTHARPPAQRPRPAVTTVHTASTPKTVQRPRPIPTTLATRTFNKALRYRPRCPPGRPPERQTRHPAPTSSTLLPTLATRQHKVSRPILAARTSSPCTQLSQQPTAALRK